MKHSLKFLFALIFTVGLAATSRAQVINFEDDTLTEGDIIHAQYANLNCGGVKFYLDSANSSIHPVLAEVGDQGAGYFAFEGPWGLECSDTLTKVDMPAPGQNVGCKFLTDGGGVGANPKDLVIVWETDTWQCSGYILDIENAEVWDVMAYDANGVLLDSLHFDSSSANVGNGIATYWSFSNVGAIKSVVLAPSAGGSFGLALDNFSTCSLQEGPCCGGGDNLQKNPDFEDGLNYFNSNYTNQITIAPNSLTAGQYAVVNGAEAATINPNWSINGANDCTDSSKFMLVNGRTNLSGKKVIWRNSYTLDEKKDWVFCVNLKNLPACGFDILPKIEILAGGTVLNTATINVDPNDPCAWQLVSTPFSTVGNTGPVAYTFKIRLAENEDGHGNDLGIDEISMREDIPASAPSAAFTYQMENIDSNFYHVNATPPFIGDDCQYSWSVCELDGAANCIAGTEMSYPGWQNAPGDESFSGYEGTSTYHPSLPKGIFEYGKRYRITFTLNCSCSDEVSSSETVGSMSARLANPSLGQQESLEKTRIYPNPARDNFTIEIPTDFDGVVQVLLMNANGQTVMSKSLEGGQRTWEVALPNIAEGVYLVQLTSGEYRKTQKLIVQH